MSQTAIIRTLSPINPFLHRAFCNLLSYLYLAADYLERCQTLEIGGSSEINRCHLYVQFPELTSPHIPSRILNSTLLAMATGWDWNADLNLLFIFSLLLSRSHMNYIIHIYFIYITNLIYSEETIYRDP